MKISLGRLREVIRKSIAGSQPDETYESDLIDDPAFKEKSVLVPDDIKKSIRRWSKKMNPSRR